MKSAFTNPVLSARAKGIYAYYCEIGKPVSADQMSIVMPEGRDALQSGINELKKAGYIKTTREYNGTKWISVMNFTNEAKKSKVVNPGFSGLLYNCNCSTIELHDSSIELYGIVELLRSSTIEKNSFFPEEETMPWNIDGEETPEGEFHSKSVMRRVKIMREEEPTGGVGKVVDKVAIRNKKYKPAYVEPAVHRSSVPESQWSTGQVVQEFEDMFKNSSAGHLTTQMNRVELIKWVNMKVKQGVTRPQVLSAMRMFFEDPRNLNNAGIGVPIWRRFLAFYQSVEGLVTREETKVFMTEKDLAHQDKMMKLLGGE